MAERILLLPSWYPDDQNPVNGIFVEEQAKTLSEAYDVAVLVPEIGRARRLIRSKQWRRRSTVEPRAGIRVFREYEPAPLAKLAPLACRAYLAAARRGLDHVLASWGRPDIIHAHVVLPAGWAATRLGREHGIPVVLTEHSGPFAMHTRTPYQRAKVRETLRGLDAAIAVGPTLQGELKALCSDLDVTVIGNVINSRFFVPCAASREMRAGPTVRFLSVALLSEGKGLAYLVRATSILLQQGLGSFEIVIGGDGPDRPRLEKMAWSMGIAQHFRFLGMLSPSEVRDWMQHADVFVLPSLHESFGVVLGEAMACGLPVISTRCGGPQFVVTPDTGILVDVADAEALAGAMAGFMTGEHRFDPKLIRQTVVRRFGEEAFLRNTAAVYERVGRG